MPACGEGFGLLAKMSGGSGNIPLWNLPQLSRAVAVFEPAAGRAREGVPLLAVLGTDAADVAGFVDERPIARWAEQRGRRCWWLGRREPLMELRERDPLGAPDW